MITWILAYLACGFATIYHGARTDSTEWDPKDAAWTKILLFALFLWPLFVLLETAERVAKAGTAARGSSKK